jgi:hypothetical protein
MTVRNESARGLPQSRTLPRVIERWSWRQLLDCASPLALWLRKNAWPAQQPPKLEHSSRA